jgi:hypothetical protein
MKGSSSTWLAMDRGLLLVLVLGGSEPAHLHVR